MENHSSIISSPNIEYPNDNENLLIKPVEQEDHKAAFEEHIASKKQTSHPLFLESPFQRYSIAPSIKITETNSGENNPSPEYEPSIADSGALVEKPNNLHITFQKNSTGGLRDLEDISRTDTFYMLQTPKTRALNSNGGLSPVPKIPADFDVDVPSPCFPAKGIEFFGNDWKKEEQDSQSGVIGELKDDKGSPKQKKTVTMALPLSPQERSSLLGFNSQSLEPLEPSSGGLWVKARRKAKILQFVKPRKSIFAIFQKPHVETEAPQRALQILHDRSFVSLTRTQHDKKASRNRTTTPKLFLILKKHGTNSPTVNPDNSRLLRAVTQLKRLQMGFFGKFRTRLRESLSLIVRKSIVIKSWAKHLKNPIKPDALLKVLWDIVIMIFIMADLVILPFRLSFEQTSDQISNDFDQYDTIQVIFYLIDILLSFNTGFYQDGNLVLNRRKIIWSYLRLWFWVDITASFPYEWVSNIIQEDNSNNKQNTLLQAVKLLRFFKLIRVIRIAKLKLLIKNIKHFIYTSPLFNGILSLIRLCIIISLLAHWIACGWRYMAISSDDGGWLREKGLETAGIKVQYIASLYFAVTTMMTVGYGDITPENPNEMVYTIIVMLLGGGMFGYAMNSIAIIVSSLEDEKVKIRKKILTVSRFMQKRGLAKDVQSAVKTYLEFMFEDEDAVGQTEKEMFDTLSPDLKDKVYDQLNGRLLYQNKVLTTNFSKKCLYYVTAIIEEKTFTPAETVLNLKDPGDCIYFINKGTLNFFVPKTDMPFLSLTKGDHFGEAYFFQATSRTFIVKSDGFSHLLFLRREKFLESLNDFPEDKEMFCMIRDKISLYKDYTMLQQDCIVCNEPGHILEYCPKLQYIPSKEEVIKSFLRRKNYEGENFVRKNRKRFNARSDLSSLAEKATTVVSIYPTEIMEIVTLKEVKEDENIIDSPGLRIHRTSFLNTLHPHFTQKPSAEDLYSLKHSPSIAKDFYPNRMSNKKITLYNPTVGEVDFVLKSDIDVDRKSRVIDYYEGSSTVLFIPEEFEFDRVKTYPVYFPQNNVNQISDRLRRKQRYHNDAEDIKRLKYHLSNFFKVKEKEKFQVMSKILSMNNMQSSRRIDGTKSELF